MSKEEKEKLHTIELVKFGMKYWENPLAQEYIYFTARQLMPKYFVFGVLSGAMGTVIVLCLL